MVKLSDFSRTCRLCSKVYRVEKLVRIFSSRGTSLNLKESLNSHLPIKVAETDTTMPKNVCINCIRRLNSTNEFFTTVITSDKMFKRLLRKKEEIKPNNPILEKGKQSETEGKIPGESASGPKKPDVDPPLVSLTETASESMCRSQSDVVGSSTIENRLSHNPVEKVNRNESKYVNIVPKAGHVVLGNGNCNGNIVINVSGNAGSVKDQQKLPIEVLRCPDCKETVKIFTVEERQLFFQYLRQHRCCSKGLEAAENRRIESFEKYREIYESENIDGEEKRRPESKEATKAHGSGGRTWPGGDSPADPGPDPSLCENIFEDQVRLDDDFYWPMPKRIRRLHGCVSCDFVTKSALRLKTHQKLHRTVDKKQITQSTTTCKHCNKRFDTVNEAKKHERLTHVSFGAKNSLCEYCGVMKPQKTLRDHVLKQHTVESEIEMQECDVCGKSFISPTSLYLHKKIHTIDKQYLCDLCGKAFKQRIAMRRHYMLHFPRAPPKFKCNICEKRVTTRGSLRLHMMRHTGEKPQECPECHMVMRHGLKHHMRLHSDESPFKCVVCGADFKRRDYVRRHMRKHLNETEQRSLRCNICEHIFDDIKNFLIHHQNIHRNEIFTQIKIYECKTCSMQFADGLQHKDHQSICKNTEREAPRKVYAGDVQSCVTINHPKVDGLEDHKDCPKKIASDRSYPCVYCDYKETNNRRKDSSVVGIKYQIDTDSNSVKHHQSRFKFEDLRRLKRPHEILDEQQNSDHVILSDDVLSLGNESSEYSYINIINKTNLRDKDMLMSVDEQIMTSSSVHVFETPVDQFSQSSHTQSQLGLHQHNESYTRESLSWKQL